jgi:pilus assembly protein CpaF
MSNTVSATAKDGRAEDHARFAQLKRDLHERLLSCIDINALRHLDDDLLRSEFRKGAEELCRQRPDLMTLAERRRLIDELVAETLGLGPLEQLLADPSVSDILINGPNTIYVERQGRLTRTNVCFYSEEHLVQVVQKIASSVGRRIDESSPMVDARLPDGSRVNAIIRPLALDGALVSIRRFASKPIQAEGLVQNGALSKEMLCFLIAGVQARLNIVISGGTGSGKTTLLNALSSFIPAEQRIVTIEDAAELQLQQPHVARMESRPPNLEGTGEVTTRDLLRNALRMRPDRILVGECRGAETLDMLQAMNTGHDGSLTTLHANSAKDAISRLQMLVGLAGIELPMWYIDRQIASGIQLVVHVARLTGGVRKIVQITEVQGLDPAGGIRTADIFRFHQHGLDSEGRAIGTFSACGVVPLCAQRMKEYGIPLARQLFACSPNHTESLPESESLAT